MGKYILKRLIQLVILLFVISFVIFFAIHLAPGDPAKMIAGETATSADVENIRKSLGLDKPVIVQYFDYIIKVFQGNFGTSYQNGASVAGEIFSRLPTTIKLAVSAMLLALIVGIPLGIIAALRKNSWVDFFSTSASLLGVSVPNFWLGTMLILVFGVYLQILPVSGVSSHWWTLAGMQEMILPTITLSVGSAAIIARTTRSSMLEVIQQDFIRTAKAKGLKKREIILTHEFRNALIPVITVAGINFGTLLGGAIVTEQVFAINGLGRLLITAISSRDFPMVEGAVLVIATIFAVVNLAVDLIYTKVDPRIKY
ncbi:ABC transporter permease [Lactiplantibacillus plantarum]|uniref:ABC transporter permease n=1 Tax=Lactiplantibacillus plantarum TaxID=1590 RepID=UPI000F02B447|nr:ABC transporter permease [Lactiplantibacillus plantarum]